MHVVPLRYRIHYLTAHHDLGLLQSMFSAWIQCTVDGVYIVHVNVYTIVQ